jgi:hypothetical protein
MESKRCEHSCDVSPGGWSPGASSRRVSPGDGVPTPAALALGAGTARDSARLAGRAEGYGESRLLAARVCGENTRRRCLLRELGYGAD